MPGRNWQSLGSMTGVQLLAWRRRGKEGFARAVVARRERDRRVVEEKYIFWS